ncbi:MAG: LamG domain-containing protein, partial [Oxalobacteraceae bacterium]|nr:LamG domain-containing protein [Oxalobacteraceae bacterium]
MDLGTGDFTIEFWYYPLSLFATSAGIIQGGGEPGAPGGDWCTPVTTYFVNINNNGTTFCIGRNCIGPDASATIALNTNTWHHLAVTRQAGTVRFFQDGVLKGTGTSYQNYLTQPTYGLRIFSPLIIVDPMSGESIDGYLDEVRIVKGEALYTAAFTPPTAPFVAAPIVTPTDVAGCDLWLDSTADIGTLNGAITVWPDKSGNTRPATPADYAPAPTLAVGEGPVGQNVVRFSGDPNVLDVAYQFNLKNSSGFVVVGQTVAPADCNTMSAERILSFQPANGVDWQNSDGMVLHHDQNNGGSGTHDVNLYNLGEFAQHSVSCPMDWTLFSYVIDNNGNVRLRRNGVEEETAQFTQLANKAGAELLIGFGGDFSTFSALRGDIAEVVIFDHALGDAALIGLERGILARCLPPPTVNLFYGLIGYWALNNDANDYTANNYDMTADGTSGFGVGKVNSGLVCSGSGGYRYGNNAPFNTAGNDYSVTVNLWFKTNATDGTIEGGRPHMMS